MNIIPEDKEARDTENEIQQLRSFIGTFTRNMPKTTAQRVAKWR